MPNDRVVKEKERAYLTGIGRTRWRQLELEGRAPLRIKLFGRRAMGWRESALQKFIRSLT